VSRIANLARIFGTVLISQKRTFGFFGKGFAIKRYIDIFQYMNEQKINNLVKKAKVLSDSSRVRLLLEIYQRGELSCVEAEEITQLSQPTVSHHLKLLAESGLIRTEKHSRHLQLFPNSQSIEELMELFGELREVKPVG